MGGNSAVRSLLEKMTECASVAYLRMLERLVILYNFFSGPSSMYAPYQLFASLLFNSN